MHLHRADGQSRQAVRAALFLLAALACSGLAGSASAQDDDYYTASPSVIAPGGITVYYNTQGPLSFVSMTPGDLPPDVISIGEVQAYDCQYKLSIPLSLSLRATNISGVQGNGSFRKAMEGLRRTHPELAGIYDVKVDLHTISLLGIFQRLCTEISARGYKQGPQSSRRHS
jgi:hypothetical protein